MGYQIIFLLLALFFGGNVYATMTTGINTKLIDASNIDFFLSGTTTGTISTIGTISVPSIPYVTRVDVTPKNISIAAGDEIRVYAEAIYNNGNIVDITNKLQTTIGTITNGILHSSLAGSGKISIYCDGITSFSEITVLPASLSKVTILMPDSFDYGSTYPVAGLVKYDVFDKYDNPITDFDQSKITYKITKNQPGILMAQLPAVLPASLMMRAFISIITCGYVVEKGQILFFERGLYTVTASTKGCEPTSKIINVGFSEPFTSVEAWKDYSIKEIDLTKKKITVGFTIGTELIEETYDIPTQWTDKFYGASMLDKMQVICYGHYLLLNGRAETIKGLKRKQLNQLLKMMIKDGTVQ